MMSDNANLTQKVLQEAYDKVGNIMKGGQPAATVWLKYNPTDILAPVLNEWCLWSMIENGDRNYFSGKLFNSGDLLMLDWDGFRPVYPNDTLYYARINKIVSPMSKEEFENKYRGRFDE